MSVQAIAWAFEAQLENPSAKLVLLALANFADEGGCCWPSQERLAAMTSQSIDSVQRRLKELATLGFVTAKRRARRASVYQLSWAKTMKPQLAASSRYDTATPAVSSGSMIPQNGSMKPQNDLMIPHCCGTEPSIESINIEPSKNPRILTDDQFQRFWEAYPPGRKTEKKAVRLKLERVLKAKEVSFERLMAGVCKYAAVRAADREGPKYTKAPLVWLNKGCWEDEYTPQNEYGNMAF